MAVAFWDRVAVTGEKIYVLSCLQEMARNVDTCALAGHEPVRSAASRNRSPFKRPRQAHHATCWSAGGSPTAAASPRADTSTRVTSR